MNVNRGAVAPFRTAGRAVMRLVFLARLAGLTGCAAAAITGCNTACDDAADHNQECGFVDKDDYGGVSCDGKIECDSECMTEAPCGAFDGTDTAARDTLLECFKGCKAGS